MSYGQGLYSDYVCMMIIASFTFSIVTFMRLSLIWSRGENKTVYNEILEARGKTTNELIGLKNWDGIFEPRFLSFQALIIYVFTF